MTAGSATPTSEPAAETDELGAERGRAAEGEAGTTGELIPDVPELARRARRLVEQAIVDLAGERKNAPRALAASAPQRLAALVRSLERLTRLEAALGQRGTENGEAQSGRSLTELRDDLYGRLVAARRERRRDQALGGEPEPGGG